MKKILALVLAALMALALIGCSNASQPAASEAPAASSCPA